MKIEFQLTTRDFHKYARFMSTKPREKSKKPPKKFLVSLLQWLFVGVVIGMAFSLVFHNTEFDLNVESFVMGAIVCCAILTIAILQHYQRILPGKNGYFRAKKGMRLNDDGIEIESKHWDEKLRWPGVWAVDETTDHFFIQIDYGIAHIVPKRAFADAAQLDQFRDLIAAHVAPVA